jgi:hypothetical protein
MSKARSLSNVFNTELPPEQIPSIDASKIATGSLDSARVPSLDASKIATGTLSDGLLPTRLGTAAKIIADWNSAVDNGWYMGANVANAPSTSWHLGNVEVHTTDWVTQTIHAFSEDSQTNGLIWRREKNLGVWGAWNKLTWFYPVGSYYVQYPDASSNVDATEFPTGQRPATLFGGTWAEQWSTESVFFRTRGAESDSARDAGGFQNHMFEDHFHYFRKSADRADAATQWHGTNYGAGSTTFYNDAMGKNSFNVDNTVSVINASSGSRGAETRPRNRRIKVWKRTA